MWQLVPEYTSTFILLPAIFAKILSSQLCHEEHKLWINKKENFSHPSNKMSNAKATEVTNPVEDDDEPDDW